MQVTRQEIDTIKGMLHKYRTDRGIESVPRTERFCGACRAGCKGQCKGTCRTQCTLTCKGACKGSTRGMSYKRKR